MSLVEEIESAHRRIRPHILKTPLIRSAWLSDACGGEVYLKMESEQHTGSFKARGALNKLMWLREQGDNRLPVTASTGNHGQGFARGLSLLEMEGKVFLPENAVSSKVEAIRGYGVEIVFHGEDPHTTERHARQQAEENSWCYVSPYNDLQVAAGQGTVAGELFDQGPIPDHILATVGGGGLISGIAAWAHSQSAAVKIIGCQPENSPEMSVSVRAGKWTEVEGRPTLSDGSAGGFDRDSITFDWCRQFVDRFVLVSEEEIASGIREMIARHSKLVEGSAAVAVAALLKEPERYRDQITVIIICGGNISADKLKEVLCS